MPQSRFAGTRGRPPSPGMKQRRFRERLSAYRSRHQGGTRRRIPREAVPSFFTLMNLFSGFLAVTQVHNGRFAWACWLIVLAAFFDVLDGMMARLTNSHSLFGTELDSLADVVSFGVAPSYLVYVFGLSKLGPLGLIVASLPVVCGAVRLARFNIQFDGEKKDYFIGLPIPGQALIICALILNFSDAEWYSRYSPADMTILLPIVFVLSFLMVSNIPFDAVPKPTPGYIKAKPRKSAAYGLAVILIIVFQEVGLLIVSAVYITYCIGQALWRITQDILHAEPEEVASYRDRDRN